MPCLCLHNKRIWHRRRQFCTIRQKEPFVPMLYLNSNGKHLSCITTLCLYAMLQIWKSTKIPRLKGESTYPYRFGTSLVSRNSGGVAPHSVFLSMMRALLAKSDTLLVKATCYMRVQLLYEGCATAVMLSNSGSWITVQGVGNSKTNY